MSPEKMVRTRHVLTNSCGSNGNIDVVHTHGHFGDGDGGGTRTDGDGEEDCAVELLGMTENDVGGDEDGEGEGELEMLSRREEDGVGNVFKKSEGENEGEGDSTTIDDLDGETFGDDPMATDGEAIEKDEMLGDDSWLAEGEELNANVVLAEADGDEEADNKADGEREGVIEGDGDWEDVIEGDGDWEDVIEGDGVGLSSIQFPDRSCATASPAESALIDFLLLYISKGTARQALWKDGESILNSAIFCRLVSRAVYPYPPAAEGSIELPSGQSFQVAI
ncbi:unnamed protein product [Agarophyton chilense]